jgi:hypothetical protein
MKNYKAVQQWASTITVEPGLRELQAAKLKYPWLKVDEALKTLEKLQKGLPEIVKIVVLQEKQNAIHRKFIEVNQLTDTAIIEAISKRFNLGVDGAV